MHLIICGSEAEGNDSLITAAERNRIIRDSRVTTGNALLHGY